MKENNRLQIAVHPKSADYRFRLIGLLALFLWFLSAVEARTQCLPKNLPFNYGEQVFYDAYFKWGILMPKAGEAALSYNQTRYGGRQASRYRLTFHTTGLFESVYRMRDTLNCYFSQDNQLLFANKRADEHKDPFLYDDLAFSYRNQKTYVHSRRYTSERVKIDTVMAGDGCVFDMLGAVFYLRTLDWDRLTPGDEYPLIAALGRNMIKLKVRYHGQEIVTQGQSVKYKTLRFSLDIYDEAFSESSSAATVWIGDDENHLPVKIRAKLKIGAAEINYKSSKGLKYPLTCRIVMPKQ